MEAYKHSQHELEILRLLTLGEKEIEAGKGYDLEVVFAEADSLFLGLQFKRSPMLSERLKRGKKQTEDLIQN